MIRLFNARMLLAEIVLAGILLAASLPSAVAAERLRGTVSLDGSSTVFRDVIFLALAGFVAMVLFLTVLVIGFIYEWKKGALEWE